MRYARLDLTPTANHHLLIAVHAFLATVLVACAIAWILIEIVHHAGGDRLIRPIAIGLLAVAVAVLGLRLNCAAWYPGVLTAPGLIANGVVMLAGLLLAILVWKPRLAVSGVLLALVVGVALFAHAHRICLASRAPVLMVCVSEDVGLTIRTNSLGAGWGDLERDGWEDLALSAHLPISAPTVLFKNRGGVVFDESPLAAGDLHGIAWCDADNDGDREVFVAGGNNTPIGPVYANLFFELGEDGVLHDRAVAAGLDEPSGRAWGGSWTDYDRDGWADLFVVNYYTPSCLFHNEGDGTFTDVAIAAGITSTPRGGRPDEGSRAAAWADYDLDGDPDLLVTSLEKGLSLFRNEDGRRFTDVAVAAGLVPTVPLGDEMDPVGLAGCAWGDYDNDLDPDLYVSAFGGNLLYENQGDGTFIDVAARAGVDDPQRGGGVAWADLDNDGDLDLIVTNEADDDPAGPPALNILYMNRGDGTFDDVTAETGMAGFPHLRGKTVAIVDYDNDGFIDVLYANQRPRDRVPDRRVLRMNLLMRNTRNGNHWLEVDLRGTVSNADGIGAKALVTAGGRRQFREQNGGGHLFAQNSMILHFGLGEAERIDQLRLEWPSGMVQVFTDLQADQRLSITEGASAR